MPIILDDTAPRTGFGAASAAPAPTAVFKKPRRFTSPLLGITARMNRRGIRFQVKIRCRGIDESWIGKTGLSIVSRSLHPFIESRVVRRIPAPLARGGPGVAVVHVLIQSHRRRVGIHPP